MLEIQREIALNVVGNVASAYGIIPRHLTKTAGAVPVEMRSFNAMLRFYNYEALVTPEAYTDALSALQDAVRVEPGFGRTKIMLAVLYENAYALDLSGVSRPLEQAGLLLREAMVADASDRLLPVARAFLFLLRSDMDAFSTEISDALERNRHTPFGMGAVGFLLSLAGRYDEGFGVLQEAIDMNPTYPNWYHGARVLYYLYHGDDTSALAEAREYDMPGNFWCPLLRCTVLYRLGRLDDARGEARELLSLQPHFQHRSDSLIGRYVKDPEMHSVLATAIKNVLMLP
jgi:tetratricopeptide (TPR) repeat protein